MKPDGLSNEMDEGEIVPSELFCGLGLLIVESRVPHVSPKGHVEGPHCPNAAGYGPAKHDCSNNSFLCGRMDAVRRQMQVLWKNHIPMCIEVLLLPDCEHGGQSAAMQDVTLPSNRDSCILLEQWTIQMLPRRGGESVARARELFQAMKSYLHFSQLSAWLNLTQGKAPRNVSYRVSPPAEFCTSSFQEPPEWHTFPTCGVSKNLCVKVTVGALPRHHNIIHVPCSEYHPLGQFVRRSVGPPMVPTKAPCRSQQNYRSPRGERGTHRHTSSHIKSPQLSKSHRRSQHQHQQQHQYQHQHQHQHQPHHQNKEAEDKQSYFSDSPGANHIRTRKMSPCFERDLEEDKRSQATGECGGRGRESPGVPNVLDFSKIRTSPKLFYEFHPVVPLTQPPPNFKLEQNQGSYFNQPPPPPLPFPYHHPHQQQGFVLPPQYLDPSLLYQKRSSPPVPRNDPVYLAQQNAFLYGQPRLHPQTPEDMPSYHHPMQHLGAIPKRVSLGHKSPPDARTLRELFPRSPPAHLECQLFFRQVDPSQQKSLKAPSPKVLMSKKSPGQNYYRREDQVWAAAVATQESTESDGSSPELDRFLKNVTTPAQPLSPEEIQNYLSRLNQHQARNRKDISPQLCRSLTDKDFAEAQLSSSFGDGSDSQSFNTKHNLPAKITQVLQEANKDQYIQKKYTTSHVVGKDDHSNCDTVVTDEERSLTPTPTRSPQSSLKVSPSKPEWTKDEKVSVPGVRSDRSSSPRISNLPPRPKEEEEFTEPQRDERKIPVANKPEKEIVNRSSPETEKYFLAETGIPTAVPAVKNIRNARRPMSPLTKQLLASDKENESQLAKSNLENSQKKALDEIVCKQEHTSRSSVSNNNNNNDGDTSGVHVQNGAAHPISNGVSTSNGATEGCELNSEDKLNGRGGKENEQASSSNGHITFTVGADEEDDDNDSVYCTPPESPIHVAKRKVVNKNNRNDSDELLIDTQEQSSDKSEGSVTNGVNITTSGATTDNSAKSPGSVKLNAGSTGLLKNLLKKDLSQQIKSQERNESLSGRPVPTPQERASFRRSLDNSTNMIFHAATGLPLQSSPAPIKKRTSACFDYDSALNDIRAIKNSLSCANLEEKDDEKNGNEKGQGRFYSASAPASTNCLLGNFEESLLNGRIEPSGVVEGFTAEIGASGTFCPKHVVLPVTAFFFNLSDDNAPSPYLGHISLESLGRRGYQVPKKGTVQVTLFNPNKTVVKMFVVMYNLSDMPPNSQTFLRQRTLYMPVSGSTSDLQGAPVFLRYLIHLRFASSKSGKIYLHTDLRLIFARDKFEYDSSVASYELRSFTEGPTNPKFSPKR